MHYIRFTTPRDVLLVRKTIQDALADTFGLTAAGTRIDVLAATDTDVVVRVHPRDAPRVLAAIAASVRCEAVRESSFLPSLVPDDH